VIRQKKYYVATIAVLMLLITYLHYSTPAFIFDLHDLLIELYYIPIFLAAVVFGLRGSVITYLVLLLVYSPYVALSWTDEVAWAADTFLHLFLQGAFGFFAGYMVDRDRRNREQMERERYMTGIGRAATAIVHDLKNPLIAILGYARRIRNGKTDIEGAADVIIDAAEHMERITHDVLDFGKPVTLELKEGDVRSSIRSACDLCRPAAQEAGVTLTEDLPGHPVRCMIDDHRLNRALVNLLKNAIEASPGGQEVWISAEGEDDEARIRIRDSGPGMDKETLKNIFIPFYTMKSSGTGLGMSIAKRIIDAHHGDIKIKSRPGHGTEIIVLLPLITSNQQNVQA